MSEQLGSSGNDLTITIPSSGDTDWATSIRNLCFQVISDHKHEASGDGAKIRGYLGISFTDALIPNNTAVLARNVAGTGTVEVMKVNTSDQVVLNGAAHIFDDDVFKVVDEADSTKTLVLSLGGATTAKGMTLISSHTDDRSLTLPDATDTLVGKATTDVLTNKTLTSPVLTTPQINDTSSDHQYIVAVSELVADRTVTLPLLTGADEFVFKDHAVTLTNKTITSAANTLTIDADAATVSNIANASIKAAAAIAVNKLAATTASRALVSDGSGFISASSVTATELGYISGVTSAVQTQLNAKITENLTTNGDISYYNSGRQRLAAGTDTHVLTLSSGIPTWAAPAAASQSLVTKSADYTVLDGDGYTHILVDDTSTDRTITLPTASANTNRVIMIKNTSTDKGKVTVDGEGAETIDGLATIDLDFKQSYITIICDGAGWYISATNLTSPQKQYSVTVTGTNYTSTLAVMSPYRTMEGSWYTSFNFVGTLATTAVSDLTLTVTGVTFYTGTVQAISAYVTGAGNRRTYLAQVQSGVSTVRTIIDATSLGTWLQSGVVKLTAKPTFVE